MTKRKRVLVILEQGLFDVPRGIQRFLLRQPDLQPFLLLIDPWAAGEGRRVRRFIEHVSPHGMLAYVSPETEPLFMDAARPVVNLGDDRRTSLPTVMMDQVMIGRLAAEHLMEQGLRNFAFGAVAGLYYAELRWRGFRDTLRAAGFDGHLLDDFHPSRSAAASSDNRVIRWLAQLPKPVGLHLSDSDLVMQTLWACQELGLNIPRDVALVGGQDNPFFGSMWDPTLTAVEVDHARLGFEGMRLLNRLLHGNRPPSEPLLIPPVRVVARGSSDCQGSQDAAVATLRTQIRENAHRPIGVKELLSVVGLSRRTVERRFESTMRHTLHEEILRAHMERAMSILRQTAVPVGQVAVESGYASYRVFAGAFRRHTRMTPTQYRRHAASAGIKAILCDTDGKSPLGTKFCLCARFLPRGGKTRSGVRGPDPGTSTRLCDLAGSDTVRHARHPYPL
jgi:LacI family transcriptional regulator